MCWLSQPDRRKPNTSTFCWKAPLNCPGAIRHDNLPMPSPVPSSAESSGAGRKSSPAGADGFSCLPIESAPDWWIGLWPGSDNRPFPLIANQRRTVYIHGLKSDHYLPLFAGDTLMKARWIVMSLSAAMLLTVGGLKAAKEDATTKEFKATCPVSGKAAGESHVVELKNGEKVYFCCDNCPKNFKQNPKKYDLKVHRQLLETGQVVQVACPLHGKPINEATEESTGETKVAFCCEKCE